MGLEQGAAWELVAGALSLLALRFEAAGALELFTLGFRFFDRARLVLRDRGFDGVNDRAGGHASGDQCS